MRLYHRHPLPLFLGLTVLLAAGLLTAGCAGARSSGTPIEVQVAVDSQILPVSVTSGATAQAALTAAGVKLGELDRVEPPGYTVLDAGDEVQVIRVREEFEVEQSVLPFEHLTLRNESLPIDTEIYLQKGQNGEEEITYRTVYEDGVEVSSRAIIKRSVIREPVTEIVMIGVQTPFVSLEIPGRLVYLRDGSAWMIETNTGNRQAVVATGDLDGRVLSLSDDGNWLLFTRAAGEEGRINRLWAKQIAGLDPEAEASQDSEDGLIDLKVDNVIHFADWMPASNQKIIFSTVEPRSAAPGWQANNDLNALTFSPNGWVSKWQEEPILEANSGGVYGWWGTSFFYSPDRQHLAYARPDGVGLLDFENHALNPLLETIPLQTGSDWAWTPGLVWSPDGSALFMVDHVSPEGSLAPEESPFFDVTALPLSAAAAGDEPDEPQTPALTGGQPIHLVSQAGMFAYPIASPVNPVSFDYQIAYLQAVFPEQSETSPYRVVVMDRDGSNQRPLFPGEQQSESFRPGQFWGAWSPAIIPDSGHYALALIYAGNLWLVDTVTGEAQQLTGDGLTQRVTWK